LAATSAKKRVLWQELAKTRVKRCFSVWHALCVRRLGNLVMLHYASDSHNLRGDTNMAIALMSTPLLAAAGYSLLYLLMGGGLGGAILIFIVAKMLGQ
jgi:hypothetical protein